MIADNEVRLSCLVSYAYYGNDIDKLLHEAQSYTRVLIDSGAYTAWKTGRQIQLDDYCRFLESLRIPAWRYFSLDVIGDPGATMRNYETMLKRGFNPIPILTRGEDFSTLEDFYKTSDMVGLGGVAGADSASYVWVRQVMERVAGRKAHILGFTSLNWVKYLRPYSCDSSSWLSAARYGTAYIYAGNGTMKMVPKKKFATKPDAQLMSRIRHYGINATELQKNDSWKGNWSLSNRLSAMSWVDASLDVQKHLNTHLFLAFSTSPACSMLLTAYKNVQHIRSKTCAASTAR